MIETLHFVLPGLSMAAEEEENFFLEVKAPHIEKLISKADCLENRSFHYEAALKTHFVGLPVTEIPFGALAALAKNLISEDDMADYLCASLVYMQPDHKSVYLRGNAGLNFTPEYNQALWDSLETLFTEDGIGLLNKHGPTAYLKLGNNQDIATNALMEAVGKDVSVWLPSGADQAYWHRLFTECQMILQNHPLNTEAAHSGKPFANSVWFWGKGVLPGSVSTPYDSVWSNDPAIQGLTQLSGKAYFKLPTGYQKLRDILIDTPINKQALIVDTTLYQLLQQGAMESWGQVVQYYDENWFEPIITALKTGEVKQVNIECADGRIFEITKSKLKFFWRSVQPLVGNKAKD